MRDSPGASIGSWAAAISKSKTSVVTALGRLRDTGLAENVGGKWRPLEETPREPAKPWVRPMGANVQAAEQT